MTQETVITIIMIALIALVGITWAWIKSGDQFVGKNIQKIRRVRYQKQENNNYDYNNSNFNTNLRGN